ncbi:MAG TPA: hypothetical protein VFE45_03050, partial [Coriobacteriia bacterium]|nr:hypothetical protein [Coriobacteriia bacterium]
LGVCKIALGAGDSGEADLREVLDAAPGHPLAAKTLSDRLLERGEDAEALAILEPAILAHPELADLQYGAGLALERLGRRGEAEVRYRAALVTSPDMEDARLGLSRLEGGQ